MVPPITTPPIPVSETAYKIWHSMGPGTDFTGAPTRLELAEVAQKAGVDQSQVVAVISDPTTQQFFDIDERESIDLIPSEKALQLIEYGLPEYRAAKWIYENAPQDKAFSCETSLVIQWAKSSSIPFNEILKWGVARGFFDRERSKEQKRDVIRLTPLGVKQEEDDDIRAIKAAIENNVVRLDKIVEFLSCPPDKKPNAERICRLLENRPELAKVKQRTIRSVRLNTEGDKAKHRLRSVKEQNAYTHEDLESGAWREIKLRPYDVTLAAKNVYPAKIHPLRKIIEQTRRAFLEMGFAEVVSPMVESAFWNFDALFQPQDHPARDMQDTFYMREPTEAPLPGEWDGLQSVMDKRTEVRVTSHISPNIVENVRQTHENGWTTGSEGWGYTWSPERSKQVVLRTHTTAATIRALAANPHPPGKFFCVGWTYRNETISFKHLPVFHQVDGIVIDEEANLASLMGTLQEFYSKMGFGRVKFKPAFYPYTEPSVDVVVYMESRQKWIEMGGAGIFRPEVTLPLGCDYPVLAWGLGIERLAMIRFGLSDIRDLYRANLDALEEVPLCR